jgi:hypothetical protein
MYSFLLQQLDQQTRQQLPLFRIETKIPRVETKILALKQKWQHYKMLPPSLLGNGYSET